MRAKSLHSYLTLCDPMDGSPPGSSVCGILQARILEWVAAHSSRGSSWPGNGTRVSYVSCTGRWVLTTTPPGKPTEVGEELQFLNTNRSAPGIPNKYCWMTDSSEKKRNSCLPMYYINSFQIIQTTYLKTWRYLCNSRVILELSNLTF